MANKDITNLTEVNQIGVVVKNMEETAKFLKEMLGIRINIINMPPSKGVLRGKEIEFKLKVGMGQIGKMSFELVEVMEGQHIFKEYVDKHGPGIHHIGLYVENLDTAIAQWEAKGGKLLQKNDHKGGIRTAYLDVENELGNVNLELIQM